MTTLQLQAYRHLKEMIMNNKFSYQEIYSETKLAKELGISRTPLRDAVHRLVQEGFIDIIPSKGFQLHQLTKKDIEETYQLRSALECYCNTEIALHYQTEKAAALFLELEELLQKLQSILDTTHSIEEFRYYDILFHSKSIEFLDNKQFTSIFTALMYKIQILALLSLAHEGRMEQTYQEHSNILNAMRNGNVKDIFKITMVHMTVPKELNLEDLSK